MADDFEVRFYERPLCGPDNSVLTADAEHLEKAMGEMVAQGFAVESTVEFPTGTVVVWRQKAPKTHRFTTTQLYYGPVSTDPISRNALPTVTTLTDE